MIPISPPKVSVIIPCYNQGKYLYESVSSALLAYSGPLEIIVIDDGSSDPKMPYYLNQVAMLSDFIRVVRQSNRGLSGARNVGIEMATGDFIQFLDADDLLIPGKLDAQVAHMIVARDLDVSVCNFLICDETCSHFYKPDEAIARFDLSLEDFLYRWERGFSIPIHCALFRASVFAETCFDNEVRAKEDWVFWCSLAIKGKRMAYLPGHYAIYRQHENSMRRSVVSMGKNWLNAALKIDSMVHKMEPLFFDSAVSWFEQYYRGHPEYRKEISRLQAEVPSSQPTGLSAGPLNVDSDLSDQLLARLGFLGTIVESPLLTVIIPIYNHFDYLEECLNSLANQGLTDIEVICIDDASPDMRVKALLRSLEGKLSRLRIIINEQNRGVSVTQNVAVELSRGEYIAFLDCDDALPPGALARVREEIIRHPEADYFFTDRLDVDESGKVLRVAKYGGYDQIRPRGPEHIRSDLLDGMIASHLKVIRRHAYIAVGGCDEELSGVQDWELALKIAEIGTFVYIPEPLYRHRIHLKSVTKSARVEQFRKTNIVRRRFIRRWLVPTDYQPLERAELQKLIQSGRAGAFRVFKVRESLPSLADLKECQSRGQACVFDLRGSVPIDVINFVREYNSYVDLILWDDPATAAALIGYLWGDVLWRQ
ncbi:glycosyl transferase, family 2 [Thermosinus carboxydivorans Nor1]|uniref:Glycosyl transferase, family 2 n=1 Tax=Thermosinus carboxydivorans Nor1 TaxID=401526 RepID=A1HMB8_9FIRM|nr:glycosyltransferase family 2 protein [Thermosinus carboxydivorans]EAX48962.1 glycosyl transferase, family 2 [Thermosinus carboxydivorans Nor1]